MNEARRKQLRELAEAARQVADHCRDDEEPMSGEDWVTLDWIAEELLALDMALAVEALEAA